MIQIDLADMQRNHTNLTYHASAVKGLIQELEEEENLMKRQGGLAEFVPALESLREKMQVQAKMLKHMTEALEEVMYCLRRTEGQIVSEYEQGRVEAPRFKVRINRIDSSGFQNLGVHIRF